jgi:molybdopterin-guanine dinucleotide biosynthesis protein
LSLGPNYAIEREPERYINELTVETEVAIRQLDPKLQNTYRHLAAKQIKYILATNRYTVFHKRQQHKMNQIKKILENNNLTIVKADKSKAIVIINKDKLNDKVNNFIKEKRIRALNKDPTEVYQKQIHQTIQKCNTLIHKQTLIYLINMKPMAPQLKVYLKTYKNNQPIRTVINNIHVQAPSYKITRFMNKKLQELFCLP